MIASYHLSSGAYCRSSSILLHSLWVSLPTSCTYSLLGLTTYVTNTSRQPGEVSEGTVTSHLVGGPEALGIVASHPVGGPEALRTATSHPEVLTYVPQQIHFTVRDRKSKTTN